MPKRTIIARFEVDESEGHSPVYTPAAWQEWFIWNLNLDSGLDVTEIEVDVSAVKLLKTEVLEVRDTSSEELGDCESRNLPIAEWCLTCLIRRAMVSAAALVPREALDRIPTKQEMTCASITLGLRDMADALLEVVNGD